MRPVTSTVSSQAAGITIPLDWRQSDFKVAIGVILSPGASLTYTVEHTFDDIQDPSVTPSWLPNDGLTAKSATDDGNIAFPVKACRLNVITYTSGSATMTIIQSGGR